MYGEITGETLISAVAEKIKRHNPEKNIYTEKTTQNFNMPAFFIWAIDVLFTPSGQKETYNVTYLMEIRYHIDSKTKSLYETLQKMGFKLFDDMRFVDIPTCANYDMNNPQNMREVIKSVRGSNIDYKINNGVLQFFVTYRFRIRELAEEIAKMQRLKINQKIKLKFNFNL